MSVNTVTIEFDSKSENEAFARVAVASLFAQNDPTLEQIADLKTAVSEAVTNAIIHGYEEKEGKIKMICRLTKDAIEVEISDRGKGIENIPLAMQPTYTTKPELERSGMGFSFMEAFMDEVNVQSAPGIGTTVTMKKKCRK